MALPPMVALEIGTSTIRVLVGELREDGVLMITGRSERRSFGVRKGMVIDFDQATAGVRAALSEAEEQAGVDIQQVHLVLSGADIRSEVNRGIVHVMNDDRAITEAEMRQAQEAARKIPLASDRELLHSIVQRYFVDQQNGVVNPEGMEGGQLALDMLIVHGQVTPLRNTIRVARTVPVDVEDVAFGGLCSALAVLTPAQKRDGVALVDLGAGTTDVLVYADQCMALASSLAVGGDHVTNDMALGLRIPTAQAERLKLGQVAALPGLAGKSSTVHLPAEGGFSGRTFRRADLDAIVHARMDELFEMIHALLSRERLLERIGVGVMLTGGGRAYARRGRACAAQTEHALRSRAAARVRRRGRRRAGAGTRGRGGDAALRGRHGSAGRPPEPAKPAFVPARRGEAVRTAGRAFR